MNNCEIRLLAKRLAPLIMEEISKHSPKPQYTKTIEEKAKELHISVSRLYKVKDQYPYEKGFRRRLMFL